MSVDQFLKWSFIAIVAIVDLILLRFCKIELQWGDLIVPVCAGIFLTTLSLYYHRHEGESLVLCMVTLLHVGSFTTVVSVLMYQTTTFNFPLNDYWLQAIDAWVGYSPSAFVNATRMFPRVDYWMTWVYMFIIPETMIAILAVAFSNHRKRLEKFVIQFMLGTFACSVIATFFPANGPLHNHGIVPTDWQQPFLDHFAELRSGEPFLFSWQRTEGLVTFPSFHTAWAIFLIVVWRQQTMWLFIPMTLLNVLIVLSTLTTGEHYLFDVFCGCLLAWGCIWVSEHISVLAYHPDGSPKVIAWLNPMATSDATTSMPSVPSRSSR